MNDSKIKICCQTIKLPERKINDTDIDIEGFKLFKFKISDYIAVISELKKLLNAQEIDRAERYYHQHDSQRFIISKAILKLILAKEIGTDVSTVKFSKNSNKKPYLALHPELHFNVSHAKNYALIVIGTRPVGVDVEYISKDFNFTEILPTVCSKPEMNEVLNAANKNLEFYKLWTRKEAVVKATGNGIDDNLIKINILDGDNVVEYNDLGVKQSMQVVSFAVDQDYIGAIAFKEGRVGVKNIILYPLDIFLKGVIH